MDQPNEGNKEQSVARYTIHLPAHGKEGRQLNHILPAMRKSLNQAGLNGRTLIKNAESDWADESHTVHLLIIDATDSSDIEQKIKDIAKLAKDIGELEGVYISKHPITHFIV